MEPVPDIERVALLREPVRRSLYFSVREAGRPVSREEAAAATGVSKSLAAFHLDRLAEGGLLDVEYRRLTGRTGRGAGRPAKLYRPSARRVALSLPATRYDLVGELLVRALESKAGDESPVEAARRAARGYARTLAAELGAGSRRRSGMARMREALAALGFEPDAGRDAVSLRNCPFHDLAQRHPALVCGLNGAFVEGLVEELADGEVAVRAVGVDPPGSCCIALERRR